MKMLFVTHKYPPSVGGMENQCKELYNGIKDKIDIVMMKLPDGKSRIWWLLTLSLRIKKCLAENEDIGCVYFHDGLSGLACRGIKRYSKVKTFVTFHGLDAVYPLRAYQRRISDNLKNNIDAAIPVSTATGLECEKRGMTREKIHVVPNGVDVSLADIPSESDFIGRLEKLLGVSLEGKKLIVSAGRSVVRKGFSWFIENVVPKLDGDIVYIIAGPREKGLALKMLLLRLLPMKLSRLIWLTGIGVDQHAIDKALALPELSGRAFHTGKLPFADLVQLLKASRAFVMPNIHIEGDAEGFGLVALEAAMCGTAVLASDIEGITEAVRHGENGLLVESGNAEAWAKTVNEICSDDKKRNALAANAPVYTQKHFSWDKMAAGYLKAFRDSL